MKVEVEQLSKRYGESFALEIPALRIEAGATFGLVGNNGAGKTTFLRLLLDLQTFESLEHLLLVRRKEYSVRTLFQEG